MKSPWPMRCCVVACVLGLAAVPARAEEPDQNAVHTLEPRAYGHVLGDLIERDVVVTLPPGLRLDPQALPKPGRASTWFELAQLGVAGPIDQPGARLELHLRYQLMNAPQRVTTLELPAIELPLLQPDGRPAAQPLQVPEWPVSASPLTPEHVLSRAGLQVMQPDVAPRPEPLRALQWRMAAWLVLALAAVAVLALRRRPDWAWWRRRRPLRDAWSTLRRMQRHASAGGNAAQALQAWRVLHEALDRSAGRALFAGQLAPLYMAQPQLQPLAADIEAFYARSRQAFFDPGAAPGQAADLQAAVDLARRLAQAEAGS